MGDLPRRELLNFSGAGKRARERARKVGVAEGAIGGSEQTAAMAALFPQAVFEVMSADWPEGRDRFDVIVTRASASAPKEIDTLLRRLKSCPEETKVIVVLRAADVATTRKLVREGAADVLPAPVSEPALALSLERLLTQRPPETDTGGEAGEIISVIKAGGGVGATAIAAQLAVILATRFDDDALVCLADLDLQFGAAALYLDLPEAVTVLDTMSAGAALAETSFANALAAHRSGARVLAAPHEVTPLDAVSGAQIEGLLTGLRRDFPVTLVDLPSVWTEWTDRVLRTSDRIVLVTHLSVPHIQLMRRQLRTLSAQRLDDRPRILVCNALSADQQSSVSIKAAERALGCEFDVVIPEDRRIMNEAINQGVEISAVRRGTKIERALRELAEIVSPAPVEAAARGRR